MEQKIFPSSDSTVDYNMSFVGKGYNIQGNGHYHRTDFMDDKIRRRVFVDAKKVFFKETAPLLFLLRYCHMIMIFSPKTQSNFV